MLKTDAMQMGGSEKMDFAYWWRIAQGELAKTLDQAIHGQVEGGDW